MILLDIVPNPVPEYIIPRHRDVVEVLFWFILAMVLPLIVVGTTTADVTFIPFTEFAFEVVTEEELMLLAVTVLPIILPMIVGVPLLTSIAWHPWFTVAVELVKVMEPMMLFLISTVPVPEYEIRLAKPPVFVCRFIEIDPLPVPDPIVLPVTVPILALPPDTQMPEKLPFVVDADELVLTAKLAMVLFCIDVVAAALAFTAIPVNLFVNVPA